MTRAEAVELAARGDLKDLSQKTFEDLSKVLMRFDRSATNIDSPHVHMTTSGDIFIPKREPRTQKKPQPSIRLETAA